MSTITDNYRSPSRRSCAKTISGIHSSTTPDPTLMPEEIDPHLSSPMSSYNATWYQEVALLELKHPDPYPTRMKERVGRLRLENTGLRDEIEELRDELRDIRTHLLEETAIKIDWEVRSLIAQELNDWYIHSDEWPIHVEYANLKSHGYSYLPYILSAWAIFHNYEPVNRLPMDNEDHDRQVRRARELQNKGLTNDVDAVWQAIDSLDRNVMILLWLSRSSLRTSIAHPKPTAQEVRATINFDHRLSPDEKNAAQRVIPEAVAKGRFVA